MITLIPSGEDDAPLLSISRRGELLWCGATVRFVGRGHLVATNDRYLEDFSVERPLPGLNGEMIRHVRGDRWTEFEGLHLRRIEAGNHIWWDCLELP